MDLTFIAFIAFLVFCMILVFLGIFFNKGKKAKKIRERADDLDKLRDVVKGKKAKKIREKQGKILTNRIVVKNEADFMQHQGSTAFIEIDENWQQMSLERTKLTIPREILTRMYPLAYLAGKLSALDEGSKVGLITMLLMIIVIVNIGITFFMNVTTGSNVDLLKNETTAKFDNLDQKVSDNAIVTDLIAKEMGIIVNTNSTVDSVGG